MAVETEFFSENLGMITSNPKFSSSLQPHEVGLVQGMGMGMEMGFDNNNNNNNGGHHHQAMVSYPCSSSSITENSVAFSQPFAALLEKHKNEVDFYLHIQGEKLKEAVQQHRRQQLMFLANSYESRTMALMREKEEDIQKLRVKTKLLEECLRKAVEETQVWQKIAREKEEMVTGLNNMLLMVQQNSIINNNNNYNNDCINHNVNKNNGPEENNDAESVCDSELLNKNQGNRERERGDDEEMKKKMVCKWCSNGRLSVVFLPCKHLCCCKDCGSVLGLCPVCHSVKQGCMEVYLS